MNVETFPWKEFGKLPVDWNHLIILSQALPMELQIVHPQETVAFCI